MKYLFYLNHPAHYHLFKNVINILNARGHQTVVTVKSKDVLTKLLDEESVDYINIMPEGRKDTKLDIILSGIKRVVRHYKICRREHPDLLIASSAELGIIGMLLRRPFITVNEDDGILFPKFYKTFGPFISHWLSPHVCNNGKYNNITLHYKGNHELAYLLPKYFTPDYSKVKDLFSTDKKNFVLRFAKLTAWHDDGKQGLTFDIINKVIAMLEPHGNVFITSERELEPEFEKYRINIKSSDMHHALYYADIYLGDSQTMAAEAAVLGTAGLRFNDFVGKLGYLEELERYGLTYGIPTSNPEELYNKLEMLLSISDIKSEWRNRLNKFLGDSIDVAEFMAWFFENYPESVKEFRRDADLSQSKFKIDNI